MALPKKKASGFTGFVDSALYTLESGFDLVAKEMAYAWSGENNNRIDEWENPGGDADYSVAGSSIAVDNESTNSMLQQQLKQQPHGHSIPSLLDEERGDDEIVDPIYDDTSVEGREQRQDTDGIFRPTKKVDLDPYAELVRMESENYHLGSRSSSSQINEIEENVRARASLLETLKAYRDVEDAGFEVMERAHKTRPPIVLNARSNMRQKPPSPEGGIVRPSQTQSPVVMKASLNLKKASLALEEVKQKRRILEQSHFHIQKQLELQKQKNRTRNNGRQQLDLKIGTDSLDGNIEVVQSNSEDEYDAKLKALELRYREIQNRKAQREAESRSDDMTVLKAEVERRAVGEIFSKINPSTEKSPNHEDGGILGLVEKTEAETPATEQKRLLNEKANDQLSQMVDIQMDLERRQRLTAVSGPPEWNLMDHYNPSLPREGPPTDNRDNSTSHEEPYYDNEVCLTPSHMDDEAVGKELDNLLSSDSFFS